MSLPHAILTALVERPSTGAGLARRFDRSIGYFWQATHQQIYRELGRLEQARLVSSAPVEDGRGRQRRYRVRAAGRRELARWVAEDCGQRAVRDELMVRLRAEAALGPSGLAAQIERRIAAERERLALYREAKSRDVCGGVESREDRLRHLVIDAGVRTVSLRLELYRDALAILSASASR